LSFDLDEVRAAFVADEERYERLCQWAKQRLEERLKGSSVYTPTVTGRSKDLISFLRKAMRKGYNNPLAEITDRVGVRVLVTFKQDVALVEKLIKTSFAVRERIDKSEELDDNELGYLGIHYLVTPTEDDSEALPDLAGMLLEIQIHTRAENAWAMASHRILYKPVGGAPHKSVRRRINRLVALVELFDQELVGSWDQMMKTPSYQQGAMLLPLEEQYLALCQDGDFDEGLSLEILGVVRRAYSDEELERFPALIREFVEGHRDYILAHLGAATRESAHPLLFQPESIAILERLETAKERLRATWDASLPARWLDSLSEELGRPA